MDGNLTRLNKYKYGIQKFRLHDVKSNTWIYGPTVIFYILSTFSLSAYIHFFFKCMYMQRY